MRYKGYIILLFSLCILHSKGQPVLDTICISDGPSHLAVLPNAGSTYSWSVQGGKILSGHGSNDILVDWSINKGLHSVSVIETDSKGCKGDEVNAFVFLTHPEEAVITGPEQVCRGENVRLVAATRGRFMWSDGTLDSVVSFTPSRDTTVFLVALNYPCANDTTYHHIRVMESPIAAIAPIQDTVSLNEEVEMFYTGLTAGRVEWMINEVYLGEGYYISAKFDEKGMQTLTQIVYSGTCTDTARKKIYVDDGFAVYIPNSFTPNGDGINDAFIFKGRGIRSYTAKIYTRWGGFVHYWTESTEEGWNGNYEGEMAKQDTYIYDIIVKDHRMREHKFTGYLSLIR